MGLEVSYHISIKKTSHFSNGKEDFLLLGHESRGLVIFSATLPVTAFYEKYMKVCNYLDTLLSANLVKDHLKTSCATAFDKYLIMINDK